MPIALAGDVDRWHGSKRRLDQRIGRGDVVDGAVVEELAEHGGARGRCDGDQGPIEGDFAFFEASDDQFAARTIVFDDLDRDEE